MKTLLTIALTAGMTVAFFTPAAGAQPLPNHCPALMDGTPITRQVGRSIAKRYWRAWGGRRNVSWTLTYTIWSKEGRLDIWARQRQRTIRSIRIQNTCPRTGRPHGSHASAGLVASRHSVPGRKALAEDA